MNFYRCEKMGFFRQAALIVLCLLFIPHLSSYAFRLRDIEIKLRPGVREEYDDNITYADSNPKSDLSTVSSFGMDAKLEGKRSTFDFRANINYHSYKSNKNFNYTSHDYTLNFKSDLSKFDHVNFSESFVRSEEPRSFEDEFGRTSGRYSYSRNRFTTTYLKELIKQISLAATYFNEFVCYSTSTILDTFLHKFSLESGYALSSRDVLSLLYEFGQRDFEDSDAFKTNRIAAGIRHFFTNQVFLDSKFGWDFVSSSGTKESGSFLSATLTNQADQTTQWGLSYLKEETATGYAQDVFSSWRGTVFLVKQLFKRLNFNLSSSYGNGEYTFSGTKDTLASSSIGFRYDLTDKIKVNLGYNFSQTESNVPDREYKKNRVYFGLTAEF